MAGEACVVAAGEGRAGQLASPNVKQLNMLWCYVVVRGTCTEKYVSSILRAKRRGDGCTGCVGSCGTD